MLAPKSKTFMVYITYIYHKNQPNVYMDPMGHFLASFPGGFHPGNRNSHPRLFNIIRGIEENLLRRQVLWSTYATSKGAPAATVVFKSMELYDYELYGCI